MKFRKRPVVVEAEQYFSGRDIDGVRSGSSDITPPHLREYMAAKGRRRQDWAWIETLEGPHVVDEGDWIITGVAGEKYPCKPDIFDATYEPA